MDALRIKNIKKQYQEVVAIDDLSFAIENGVVTGIVGPNGSGKSTAMNIISGMISMDDGALVIGEKETLKRMLPYEAPVYGITRTFQEVRLWEQMSVLDNLLVVLTERDLLDAFFERHGAFHLEQAEVILKRVDMWGKKDALVANLSYGQRKLIEIARALAMGANIYLFDEPFAGLFPEMRKIVTAVIKELKQEGKTVILIEHNMGLIRELCDHLIVMDSGKLLAEGKPEEVLARRDVVEAYLGE
ncbi:MAG: ABC transporter related protein [Candidatus Wolfebacteria bacterium GW2011_GWC2_39_22]|uniref:ABC transporter related protein n=1 Tax=Candidatus Wolfebacteria bacterium GW2011_GWC2_39_22 TaxID=1619013 RepID=A0A0G0N9Y2_9BACT|nr:MAG: ABC transporter related protein [Candidatus Wolfebacteria bacterium GW2011_GWC2_39_22]HBI25896.1 ABC transporter ATP-binding protein [Candidatus Wolfebacteria bacterium]